MKKKRKRTLERKYPPPHITDGWDEHWNPICVSECPACAELAKAAVKQGKKK